MSELKLFMFGTPRIVLDGRRVEFGLRKSTALLVYLAATRRAHSREHLASLLWPDFDQSRALGNLRRALYRVNHAGGDGELVTAKGDLLQLNSRENDWLDIEVFQRHAQAGLEPPGAGEEGGDLDPQYDLKEAARLYTHDFLAGFTLPDAPAFDEWQFFQAEDLRSRFKEVLRKLVVLNK